jgi:hypothetical protein
VTSPRRPGRRIGVRAWLLAVLAVVGLLAFGTGTASARTLPDAGNRVRVSTPETITAVGVSEHITAGQGRGPPVLQRRFVVATGVAAETAPAAGIRFSQSSVNGAAEIEASMRANGWVGDAIDVVRLRDGGLTSVDNTRLLAAKRAGIDVQANIHAFDDALPSGMVERFTTAKGGVSSTWGEAVMNRIGSQSAGYRNANPFGSWVTGWSGN